MDHSEAVQQMATERYLLDELSPEVRDAFEEHMFDCTECALDVRTADAFIQEARAQLPELTAMAPAASPARPIAAVRVAEAQQKKEFWFTRWTSSLMSPAFAAPVFAALLLLVGYQNLVTYPALRSAASEAHIAPTAFLHSGARGVTHVPVEFDPKQGTALLIDTPQQQNYLTYSFELRDPQGKLALTVAAPVSSSKDGAGADGTLSLAIPGEGLETGTYTLVVAGIAANGDRTEIERHILDFHQKN